MKRRNAEDAVQPNKHTNVGKYVVTGSRTSDRIRKMKSPLADIFVYGVPRDTTKEDIVEDLEESEIQTSPEDGILMSKGNPSVVSYRISVKAEDLSKALDPSVWPLRVKVREFIHYKKRPPLHKTSVTSKPAHISNSVGVSSNPVPNVRLDGIIFNVSNDVTS